MRVLFWSGTFWPHIGGVEVMASKLLPALRERGYEYLVVAPKSHPDQSEEAEYRGIPVRRFPFWTSLSYNDIEQLADLRQQVVKLKRAFALDLIHINAVSAGDFFHLTTMNAHPAPLLVTLHGEWQNLGTGQQSLVEQTLRAADWVTGCSAAILETGRRLVPEITTRSSVIYNGLEFGESSEIRQTPERKRALVARSSLHRRGLSFARSFWTSTGGFASAISKRTSASHGASSLRLYPDSARCSRPCAGAAASTSNGSGSSLKPIAWQNRFPIM